jgi:glycosyltransferase involved in cell wall biosynthesis
VYQSGSPLLVQPFVDDGSPDKRGDYVQKGIAPYLNSNPSRQLLKVIFSHNIGVASSRNRAIELAVGIGLSLFFHV